MGRKFAYRGESGIAQANRAAKNNELLVKKKDYEIYKLVERDKKIRKELKSFIDKLEARYNNDVIVMNIVDELKEITDNNK